MLALEFYAILLFVITVFILMSGYPVAFSLAGGGLAIALIGFVTGDFDVPLGTLPSRMFGIMSGETLVAIPLFVFMGVLLERAKIAEDLLETMGLLFGKRPAGLGISVFVVGALLAASTGIVGATVVTMGLISLPAMLKNGYDKALASGIVTASGTLGQIIPPSIILIILGDQLATADLQARQMIGDFSSGGRVSVGHLFLGAMIPGIVLVFFYIMYLIAVAFFRRSAAPPMESRGGERLLIRTLKALLPPVVLVVCVLGSIMIGAATPTEAASVGCVGAMVLAAVRGQLNRKILEGVMQETLRINSMVFMILIGASIFSLAFRGVGGDELVADLLVTLPGGKYGALIVVMLVMFVMGFFLDFFEITFVVVPVVGPVLLQLGFDPIWLGVMIALNLQTSFLTPPFGFALFYLRGVAPSGLQTSEIYRGAIPFIAIQVLMLTLLALWPELSTWLPGYVYD